MDPKDYKIEQQRVWPFPKTITKGNKEIIVSKELLKKADILGVGGSLIHQAVVDEFNDFVFYGPRAQSGSTKISYSINIKSVSDLSNYDDDESYTLDIDAEANIKIEAPNYIGAVRALATLSQLIRKSRVQSETVSELGSYDEKKIKYQYVIENVPLKIEDSPGVSHRAVMLDCSRHFLSVDFIKKQIRAMAFQKLNVLHLHLTDGQSFPLALNSLKEEDKNYSQYSALKNARSYTETIALGSADSNHDHNIGAYSPEETYSTDDIHEIIDYAKAYAIVVMPEIDTPGHTYSWAMGFPSIMTCYKDSSQSDRTCPEPPCGFFNLSDSENLSLEDVMVKVKGVFLEVIQAFKLGQPGYGKYVHLGFDEVGCPCEKATTKKCQKPSCVEAFGDYSVAYLKKLLHWFETSHSSLTAIMWIDQILTSNYSEKFKSLQDICPNKDKVIFQFWTLANDDAAGHIKDLAKKGYRIINSQASTYYLDAGGQGNSFIAGGPIMSRGDSNGSTDAYSLAYQKYWISTYSGVSGCEGDNCVKLNNGWETSFEDIYLNNITYLPTKLAQTLVHGKKVSYENIPMVGSGGGKGGIIGASVALWGEQIDETNLEQKLWPKATSFAEAMWKFNPDRLPDNIVNVRYRLAFTREDLLRLDIQASPITAGDVFRKIPWGPLNSDNTSLMHDINDLKNQQIPEGYIFRYTSHWYTSLFCGSDKVKPINPFCGSKYSENMACDLSTPSALYVQPLCPIYSPKPTQTCHLSKLIQAEVTGAQTEAALYQQMQTDRTSIGDICYARFNEYITPLNVTTISKDEIQKLVSCINDPKDLVTYSDCTAS